MYDVLPPFWLLDAEVIGGVVGGTEVVKSINDDVDGADDDELGKKLAMGLEEWIWGLGMSFLLGGIVWVVNRRMWEVSALILLHP
jgi:hypothetical protein